MPLCICASVSVRPCVRASVHDAQGHTGEVNSVAWCKGDQLASASDDQSVVVWNVASGEQVSTLKGHTGPVNSIAWGQGNQIASASDDGTVVVWNVASGEQDSTLKGHTGEVHSVAWSQGNQITSALDDQSVVVWNVASGRGYRRSRTHMSCQQRLVGQVQLTPFSLR